MNARATAISLNSIDEKVRSLEGTSRAVPIDMKSLDDRINNLIATAKEWKVYNINKEYSPYHQGERTFDITSEIGFGIDSNTNISASIKSNNSTTAYIVNTKQNFTISSGYENKGKIDLIRNGNIFQLRFNSDIVSRAVTASGTIVLYK